LRRIRMGHLHRHGFFKHDCISFITPEPAVRCMRGRGRHSDVSPRPPKRCGRLGGQNHVPVVRLGVIGRECLCSVRGPGRVRPLCPVSESFAWQSGLDMKGASTLPNLRHHRHCDGRRRGVEFQHLEPDAAMVWSAQINGSSRSHAWAIIDAPGRRAADIMGPKFVIRPRLRRIGWYRPPPR